jgi:integrase
MEYGIALDACTANPARALLRNKAVVIKPEVTHMGSIQSPAQIGVLMKGVFEYAIKKTITGTALILIAHTFQRPFNIRSARWEDFDLDGGKWGDECEVVGPVWRIPATDMKRRKAGKTKGDPHYVPLARQVVTALRRLHGVTGDSEFLFPSVRGDGKYLSDGTINKALRLIGFPEVVGHGFRSMARSVIGNKLHIPGDVVEAQLAHSKSGPLGDAYDRAEFLEKRTDMMQQWADYLESLRLNPPLKLAA